MAPANLTASANIIHALIFANLGFD